MLPHDSESRTIRSPEGPSLRSQWVARNQRQRSSSAYRFLRRMSHVFFELELGARDETRARLAARVACGETTCSQILPPRFAVHGFALVAQQLQSGRYG